MTLRAEDGRDLTDDGDRRRLEKLLERTPRLVVALAPRFGVMFRAIENVAHPLPDV